MLPQSPSRRRTRRSPGSIFAVYNGGVYIYTLSGTTLSQSYNNTGPSAAINTTNVAVGFDSGGNMWTSDGGSVYKFTVSSGTRLVFDGIGSLIDSGAYGTSFGAAAGGVMYFGEGTGEYTGYDTYTCSGSCRDHHSFRRRRPNQCRVVCGVRHAVVR